MQAQLGGAIYISRTNALTPSIQKIAQSVFTNNLANYGGAVYLENVVDMMLTNNTFTNNTAINDTSSK